MLVISCFMLFVFNKSFTFIERNYQPQPEINQTMFNSVTKIIMEYGKQPIDTAQEYATLIFENANNYNVDPFLILSIIFVESTFKDEAKSNANAIGLMQVIYKWHKEKVEKPHHLYDPKINVQVGTQIIREYMDRSKTEKEALLRYNGSLGKSDKYAKKVKKYRTIFKQRVLEEVKDVNELASIKN